MYCCLYITFSGVHCLAFKKNQENMYPIRLLKINPDLGIINFNSHIPTNVLYPLAASLYYLSFGIKYYYACYVNHLKGKPNRLKINVIPKFYFGLLIEWEPM